MVVKFTATRRFLLVLLVWRSSDYSSWKSIVRIDFLFRSFLRISRRLGSKLQLLARGDELESSWIVRGYLYFGFFIPMESRI